MKKFALLGAAAALAVAIPATADAAHTRHPDHHPIRVIHCHARDARYTASGTLTAWNLTPNADGTFSGTVAVDVLHGDRHAAAAIGATTTYTVTDAHVRFGRRATDPPAADSRIRVLGHLLVVGARCDRGSYTATPTIGRIVVRAPAVTSAT